MHSMVGNPEIGQVDGGAVNHPAPRNEPRMPVWGLTVFVIIRKFGSEMSSWGWSKFAWLKRLYAWAPNAKVTFSVSFISFISARTFSEKGHSAPQKLAVL